MDDCIAERQRRLQDRFEKSHALRNEQDRIKKKMADLEQDFQDCQNSLKIVQAKIKENETVGKFVDLIGGHDANPNSLLLKISVGKSLHPGPANCPRQLLPSSTISPIPALVTKTLRHLHDRDSRHTLVARSRRSRNKIVFIQQKASHFYAKSTPRLSK